MEQKTKQAYKCAKQMAWKMTGTVYKLPDNKLNAYRQKLTSALTFEDFDRFNIVLLNLSNYVDEPVDFAYDLFEDFEKNKELAYTFVNAMRSRESLKNAIMVQSGMYDDLETSKDGAAQKKVNEELNAANCRALEGGYMSTQGTTCIRKSSFYLTDAIATEHFVNENRFHREFLFRKAVVNPV